MKILFIIGLFHIRLTGMIGRGIRLPFDLILTNDQEEISKLLSSTFEECAGTLETSALRKANAAIYSIFDAPDGSIKSDEDLGPILNRYLERVQRYLMALWLVKDNAVNVELGFLAAPYGKSQVKYSSNFRAVRFSKADGSINETEFTASEARLARDHYSTFFGAETIVRESARGFLLPEDFNRLSRMYYFMQAARDESDLGSKIAQYMTCFEALFCTDSQEMSHKLAERLAFFLGTNGAERKNIFQKVKASYNVRSKTVHGDKINKKLAAQATDLVEFCDELLRKSLHKIFTTPELVEMFCGLPTEFEEYFTNLILGCSNDSM